MKAIDVRCPFCAARPSKPCTDHAGNALAAGMVHGLRKAARNSEERRQMAAGLRAMNRGGFR
jgi:hypothetical protein